MWVYGNAAATNCSDSVVAPFFCKINRRASVTRHFYYSAPPFSVRDAFAFRSKSNKCKQARHHDNHNEDEEGLAVPQLWCLVHSTFTFASSKKEQRFLGSKPLHHEFKAGRSSSAVRRGGEGNLVV